MNPGEDDEWPFRVAVGCLLLGHALVRSWAGGWGKARAETGAETKVVITGRGEGVGWMLGMVITMLPWMVAPLWYVADPGGLDWARFGLPEWVRWCGVGLGALSVVLLAWTHGALAENFSSALRIRSGHRLITGGPYRWVRHPMYGVAMLAWLALGLATANGFLAFGAVVFAVWIGGRMEREEAMLVEAFGAEYRDYQGRTGRLWPRWGWRRGRG